uniref:Uncharacterized protein n=1 Tax=Ixodes ricinus TaxID=34613 RepID=A0A6B0U7J3_IXORI
MKNTAIRLKIQLCNCHLWILWIIFSLFLNTTGMFPILLKYLFKRQKYLIHLISKHRLVLQKIAVPPTFLYLLTAAIQIMLPEVC